MELKVINAWLKHLFEYRFIQMQYQFRLGTRTHPNYRSTPLQSEEERNRIIYSLEIITQQFNLFDELMEGLPEQTQEALCFKYLEGNDDAPTDLVKVGKRHVLQQLRFIYESGSLITIMASQNRPLFILNNPKRESH